MIYVTGDKHGGHSMGLLGSKHFPESKDLTKDDYVIIAGDFGIPWINDGEDRYWMKWLKEKPFTTLFVDGNHENHDYLDSLPVEEWNGGKIHKLNDSIYHLMRGQVFTIDGKSIFTFGGAKSMDKHLRVEGRSWWAREMPSYAEYEEGLANLEAVGNKVDYIITHTCSTVFLHEISHYCIWKATPDAVNDYLWEIEKKVEYKNWFIGHFHEDEVFDKRILVYSKLIKL